MIQFSIWSTDVVIVFFFSVFHSAQCNLILASNSTTEEYLQFIWANRNNTKFNSNNSIPKGWNWTVLNNERRKKINKKMLNFYSVFLFLFLYSKLFLVQAKQQQQLRKINEQIFSQIEMEIMQIFCCKKYKYWMKKEEEKKK